MTKEENLPGALRAKAKWRELIITRDATSRGDAILFWGLGNRGKLSMDFARWQSDRQNPIYEMSPKEFARKYGRGRLCKRGSIGVLTVDMNSLFF